MRKILLLMLPLNFSGSIYSKAATAICLPIIMACFAASAWSNIHGVAVVFSALPATFVPYVQVAVVLIDPIAWLAFVLFIVSAVAFQALEKKQDDIELKNLDIGSYKRRSLLAATIFLSITISLTYLSYRLSSAGGQAKAGAYIDEKHAPEALASIIDGRLQALASEKKALAGSYSGALSEAVAARAAAEKAESSTAGWADGNEKNWADYARNVAAKTAKATAQSKIDAIREAIAIKETIAEKAHQAALDAEKQAHGRQAKKHETLASDAESMMAAAVSGWTLAGLIAQAVACALTFGQYTQVAYALLVYEMKERAGSAKEISKQLLALSGGSEAGARATVRRLVRSREQQQALPESTARALAETTITVQALPEPLPVVAQAGDSALPAMETSSEAIARALDGQGGFKLAWIREWKTALLDSELMPKPLNPNGASKESLAVKYDCGKSHIDNLRRCRTQITAFAGSEAAFLAAIENV